MSFLLKHLKHAYAIEQALEFFQEKVVILRFGIESDIGCMEIDELLYNIEPKLAKFAVIYAIDLEEVSDFTEVYELYSTYNIMFFFRNKHIQVDCGSGDNTKIDFSITEEEEFIAIVELVYEAGLKGRGLAVAPKQYSRRE
ncbi:Dim1 family like protein [Aduncisulcus paluster]|uniref:Dim1 family like protein n=1 Tax=Aduncisulcus paluster TaxID=2918883 RepID=A0ABQ5K354_9EUKA|nr:Dim1 family like protein [Aduncisulcus paluster]